MSVVAAVLTAQLGGLIAYSTYLFGRFDVAEDFAHNVQAWFLIGHGDADPVDTVRTPSTLFIRDHFDLVLWPLSLLRVLSSSPLTLLIVQDVCIVAAEAITMVWVVRICEEHLERRHLAVEIAALVLLVTNAWWYETVSFDFHLPPIGLPLVLLVGYLLWCGRFRWAAVAAACCLLFGAVVVELLVFVGLGALLTRRVRRRGGTATVVMITVGAVVWVLVVSGLGADQASNVTTEYSRLVGSAASSGVLGVTAGVLTHPWAALRTLASRWRAIGRPLVLSGLLGVVTPTGALVAVGILVPAALATSPAYSSPASAFQTLPVVPFVLVATVALLTGWTRPLSIGGGDRWFQRLVVALAVVLVVAGLAEDGRLFANLRHAWWRVSPPAAAALGTALARTPASAEVVASNGIVGRFAERRFVYSLAVRDETFPVDARNVVFVISCGPGNEVLSAAESLADASYVSTALHARPLVHRDGVLAYDWRPPPGVRTVTLGRAGVPSRR